MTAGNALRMGAIFRMHIPCYSVHPEVARMGQRRLFEAEDGTAPGEVWETLPAPAQSRVTLQLARLILRLWHPPAAEPDSSVQEDQHGR